MACMECDRRCASNARRCICECVDAHSQMVEANGVVVCFSDERRSRVVSDAILQWSTTLKRHQLTNDAIVVSEIGYACFWGAVMHSVDFEASLCNQVVEASGAVVCFSDERRSRVESDAIFRGQNR